jgi:uncharacterized protein (TIGR02246 family)
VPGAPVDVVRACIEAWREGDFERALSFYAEDAVWQTGGGDGTVRRGRDGVTRGMEEWTGAFSGYWLEVDEFVEAAGGKVLMLGREGGVGKASGARVSEEAAMIFTVEDGLITCAWGYPDHAAAFAAAGIDPR